MCVTDFLSNKNLKKKFVKASDLKVSGNQLNEFQPVVCNHHLHRRRSFLRTQYFYGDIQNYMLLSKMIVMGLSSTKS